LHPVATIMSPEDGLPLAKRRLADAVATIADPVPLWVGGTCRWGEPIYAQLRSALRDKPQRHTPGWRAVAPCRLDALALIVEVDSTVATWEPNTKGSTIDRLHQLIGRGYRPQDVALITGYSDRLQWWAITTTELLAPEARVYLRQPCPACGAHHCYRDRSDERVRAPALKVSETGCWCGACQAFWSPDQFHWLARLLGCPALPA
jgi:hypothetical protein